MEDTKSSGNKGKIFLIVAGVIVVAMSAATIYFFIQYQGIKKNPNQVSQAETKRLVKLVGELISLPADESPTLATVQDKSKLAGQSFFENTQNGDVILIYTKAKKAIVYREKGNKIINVGPISIDQQNGTPVALVNAGGNTDSIKKALSDKFGASVTVASTTDAKNKSNVKQLTVVDSAGNSGELAKQIAEAIGGTVGSLPSGETAPTGANIVIFVK
jgi:uncharacterized protein (UPF0333 family)